MLRSDMVSDIEVFEKAVRVKIDEILDKISSLGIASLTIEERLFLDNYSNEKRD
jgi:hypothetical protein